MSTSDLSLEVEAQDSPTQRFRKKPIEIAALQWTGDNWEEVLSFFGTARVSAGPSPDRPDVLEIDTLEGSMAAQPGDWIIRGIKGEFYPCKPDIFAATYDVAPEPLELTEVEKAAAARSEHMSTCHEEACVKCMRELRVIRRIVKAIRPVIAEQEKAGLVERIAAAIESYEPESHPVMCPPSVTYAFAKEKAASIVRGFAPVAAASNPTPIPDGEER